MLDEAIEYLKQLQLQVQVFSFFPNCWCLQNISYVEEMFGLLTLLKLLDYFHILKTYFYVLKDKGYALFAFLTL